MRANSWPKVVDPLESKRAHRRARAQTANSVAALTFDQCVERYLADKRAGWRSVKHAEQWRDTLAVYASLILGKVPVDRVTMLMVKEVLSPIWTTIPVTAGRVRARIENVLDWATAHGLRTGDNPARWKGHLANVLPPPAKLHRKKHLAAMPYTEISSFLALLRQDTGSTASAALEFAILTAARSGEVLGARWDEIDVERAVWVIPGERMKGGREHRVPLSAPALAVLERMAARRESQFVFPGHSKQILSHNTLYLLIRRFGRGDCTTHGFRSSFRDWAADQTSFSREVAEAALAHVRGDETERAYARTDLFEKRRRLMAAWSEYCGQPSGAGEVVPLRRHLANAKLGGNVQNRPVSVAGSSQY
jgi:integrase